MTVATLALAACGGSGDDTPGLGGDASGDGAATTETTARAGPDGTSDASRPDAPPAARAAAEEFVAAWVAGDREAAEALAAPGAVEALFATEAFPVELTECFAVGTDQFDCNLEGDEGRIVIARVELVDGAWTVTEAAVL